MKLFFLAGSLRKASLNGKLSAAAAAFAAGLGARPDVAGLGEFDIPVYSGDLEDAGGVPAAARELAARMAAADAVVVASPEYNRSIPGGLKNAFDWISRLDPDPFEGRPFLLLSASPGKYGGARGLEHLRASLEKLGASVHGESFSLPRADAAFAESGELAVPESGEKLRMLMEGFMGGLG